MGLTKSVQPYWRLAIATIPTIPTISWTHRAPVEGGLPGTDCDAVPMLIHLHCGSDATWDVLHEREPETLCLAGCNSLFTHASTVSPSSPNRCCGGGP